jgi:hypothetical protein
VPLMFHSRGVGVVIQSSGPAIGAGLAAAVIAPRSARPRRIRPAGTPANQGTATRTREPR